MKRLVALLAGVDLFLLSMVVLTSQARAEVRAPNGMIAFARLDPGSGETVTYTANPDGSHVHQLVPGFSGFPHWSPDGSEIAVLCCDRAAVIVDPDTGSFRELAMPDSGLFVACPVWSPDGSRLACGGFGELDPRRTGIYTIRSSDGGGLTRVTSNPGGADEVGSYAPDGKRLVFARTNRDGDVGIYAVRLNGSGLRRITPPGIGLEPGGGRRLVTERGRDPVRGPVRTGPSARDLGRRAGRQPSPPGPHRSVVRRCVLGPDVDRVQRGPVVTGRVEDHLRPQQQGHTERRLHRERRWHGPDPGHPCRVR